MHSPMNKPDYFSESAEDSLDTLQRGFYPPYYPPYVPPYQSYLYYPQYPTFPFFPVIIPIPPRGPWQRPRWRR